MRSWVLVVVLACGGPSNEPAKPLTNTAAPTAKPAVEPDHGPQRPTCERGAQCALKFIEYFSASICACKDKACADRVVEDYTAWGSEMAKTATAADSRDIDAEVTKKMTDAATKFSECYTKLAIDQPNAGSNTP